MYKAATTIRGAINLGACMRDLDADFKAGHLTCEEASTALAEEQAAGEVTTCNPTSRKTRRRSWTKPAAASDVVEPSVLPLPMLPVEVQTSDVAPDDLPIPISFSQAEFPDDAKTLNMKKKMLVRCQLGRVLHLMFERWQP